jgi:uncharacterized paraquat-inducible protein A
MKVDYSPRAVDNDIVEPAHSVEIVCQNCGFDLDESELQADTCADCGTPLNLKQSISIQVTTLPPVFGDSM